MNTYNKNLRLLVTGASGKLGHEVVKQLQRLKATNVVAGSRHPEALNDLITEGTETIKIDFDNPESLAPAFAGINRALIISTDAKASAEQRLRQQLAAVDAAVRAGVQRIVYTSMPKPEPGSLISYAYVHYETELAIERSGIPFTILRVNSYADNIYWWLPPILSSGRWITSAGEGRVAYIDRRDVARTAAAALTAPEAIGRVDVGGTEAFSASDVVALVEDIFSVPLILQQVTDEQRKAGFIENGIPEVSAKHLTTVDATTRNGGFDSITNIVDRLTGTPPRSFREFLIENRDGIMAAVNRLK